MSAAHSPLYMPSVFKPRTRPAREKKQYFDVPRREWVLPVVTMLTMALVGLSFYPAIAVLILILVKLFKTNRTDFIIIITMMVGRYGFIQEEVLGVKFSDIAMVLAVVFAFIYRKDAILKKTLLVFVLYAILLFVIAMFSIERMSVQMVMMRGYLSFIYFMVPVACFANRQFDIKYFFKRITMYAMIICVLYIIDAFVMFGDFFVPLTSNASEVTNSLFDPYIRPFSFINFRKLPRGMYVALLAIYPIARYYRLHWWQWAIVLIALMSTQTFTLISGVVLIYVFFQGKIMKVLKYSLWGLLGFLLLYGVDCMLPKADRGVFGESTLRIKSTIDQFVRLTEAVDDEDLANFASGRMAQIIPKVELVCKEHKQWTGLGFLHPENTHINRYIIDNELYIDVAKSEELAIGVENSHVEAFLASGFIGLFAHYLILLALCLIARPMKYGSYFISMVCICLWMGVSGLASPINILGLALIGLSFAVVYLQHRNEENSEREGHEQVERA